MVDWWSCLVGTYSKEDPLHLQESTGHNRVHLRSAVLALPSMLCWILSTWLDNKRILLLWSSSLVPVSLCLAAFLIVIHCRFATVLTRTAAYNSVWCLWFICPLFTSSHDTHRVWLLCSVFLVPDKALNLNIFFLLWWKNYWDLLFK